MILLAQDLKLNFLVPQRNACGVCSLCKRGALEDCIDKYCSEEETGRLQRAHMKELYLKFLEVAPKRDNQMCCSRGHQTNPIKEVNTLATLLT